MNDAQRFEHTQAMCAITGCAKPKGESTRSLSAGRLATQRGIYLVVSQRPMLVVNPDGTKRVIAREHYITTKGQRRYAMTRDGRVRRRRQ